MERRVVQRDKKSRDGSIFDKLFLMPTLVVPKILQQVVVMHEAELTFPKKNMWKQRNNSADGPWEWVPVIHLSRWQQTRS
jgi:hypothetical protein